MKLMGMGMRGLVWVVVRRVDRRGSCSQLLSIYMSCSSLKVKTFIQMKILLIPILSRVFYFLTLIQQKIKRIKIFCKVVIENLKRALVKVVFCNVSTTTTPKKTFYYKTLKK